ncbi:MAG: hypothetical protein ABIH72_04135 [archaeon]
MKILCLGNEFVKEDSLAKEVAGELAEYNIIMIKDSFQLIEYLNSQEKIVILDVVENLKEVREISLNDLQESKISTAHDLDASFILQLIGLGVRIIGIPQYGDKEMIKKDIKEKLEL